MENKEIPLIDCDNKSNVKSFEYDVADTHMLYKALSLAMCTAMMYGERNGQYRLMHYHNKLKELSPKAAEYLDNDYTLPSLIIDAYKSTTWSLVATKPSWYYDKFNVDITLDNTPRKIARGVTEAQVTEIKNMISELMPLTCEYINTN